MLDILSSRFKRLQFFLAYFIWWNGLCIEECSAYNYLLFINNLQTLTNNECTDMKNQIKTEAPEFNTIYY